MSKEAQVEQLTDYMAKFIAHVAKKLPDDVIAKLTELRAQEDSPLSKHDLRYHVPESGTCGKAESSELPRYRRAAILGKMRHKLSADRRTGGTLKRSRCKSNV